MIQYIVSVQAEDGDDIFNGWDSISGPFKSYERAVEFAARIGRNAGLNVNNFGNWAGTDGDALVCQIHIRQIRSPNRPRDIGVMIANWFSTQIARKSKEED